MKNPRDRKVWKKAVALSLLTAFFMEVQAQIPTQIKEFSVKYIPQSQSVNLHWATQNEEHPIQFIIERSLDSLNFVMVGDTKSNGEKQQGQSYYFNDSSPVEGSSFYRIRQLLKNGSQYVTKALEVKIPIAQMELAQLLITNDGRELNFAVISPDSSLSHILVSDVKGNIKASYNLQLKRGANTHSLYTGNLVPGVYFLQVNKESDESSVMKKFMITSNSFSEQEDNTD